MAIKKSNKDAAHDERKQSVTRVHIIYDIGFGNTLFIRGSGAGLSWEKGIPLNNVKGDEWLWETKNPFNLCEFKVLINDQSYEQGDNHILSYGEELNYTPVF